MFRRVLFPSLGALALLVALGAPGQVHAQRMRGGSTNRAMSGFRPSLRPVFPGRISPGFNRGMSNRFGGADLQRQAGSDTASLIFQLLKGGAFKWGKGNGGMPGTNIGIPSIPTGGR